MAAALCSVCKHGYSIMGCCRADAAASHAECGAEPAECQGAAGTAHMAHAEHPGSHGSGVQLPPGSFGAKGSHIARDHVPALERFLADYMCCSSAGCPVVLSGEPFLMPAYVICGSDAPGVLAGSVMCITRCVVLREPRPFTVGPGMLTVGQLCCLFGMPSSQHASLAHHRISPGLAASSRTSLCTAPALPSLRYLRPVPSVA